MNIYDLQSGAELYVRCLREFVLRIYVVFNNYLLKLAF